LTAFVVAYDLNKEVKRPQIVTLLKKMFPEWAMLSESSYAIETTLGAKQVYDVFAHMLDSNDALYVIHLRNPWWGSGPQAVLDWLKSHLRD